LILTILSIVIVLYQGIFFILSAHFLAILINPATGFQVIEESVLNNLETLSFNQTVQGIDTAQLK